MKNINMIIATFVFIFQSSYGFNYYNPLIHRNRWIPENKDEEIGYKEYIEKVDKPISSNTSCNNSVKRKMNYINNNEIINFNQDGEISMLE
tara:strand:- start:171 stop:443 length:273 start_codon:yes stop_codon:yes gene_type:complete